MGSVLAIIAAIPVGWILWSLTSVGSSYGAYNDIDGTLTILTFWIPILVFVLPKVAKQLADESPGTAAWIIAGAPVIGFANVLLAMGIGALLLSSMGKDISLRIGMAIAIAIWLLQLAYVIYSRMRQRGKIDG